VLSMLVYAIVVRRFSTHVAKDGFECDGDLLSTLGTLTTRELWATLVLSPTRIVRWRLIALLLLMQRLRRHQANDADADENRSPDHRAR